MRALPSSPRLLLPLLAVAAGLALSGCVDATPQPSGTNAPPAPTTTEPVVPSTNPATEPQGELDISCEDLVDPDAVYAFDPNFALIGAYTPDAGTPASDALAAGGVACRLVRESGSGSIDLSVAKLSDSELTTRKDEAYSSSEMVPTYGDEAYFDPETGTATVFQGSYWLVISSDAFAEPGEPTEIINGALAALP